MSHRFIASLSVLTAAIVVVLLVPVPVAGQAPTAAAKAKTTMAAKTWTPPPTPWGQPDLQGIWSNATITPLERPSTLAGKEVLTDEEAAQLEQQAADTRRADRAPRAGDTGAYNQFWLDFGTKVIGTKRSSLIVDPADGRIPPYTSEGRKRADASPRLAGTTARGTDGPEQRSLWERCVTYGLPMVPGAYNNNYQILQAPGYVAILHEMIHEARIIPLDGRPHLGEDIRQWRGDSRGRWEGQTLVVDTTNFSPKIDFRGSAGGFHLVERFTRVDADTINYEFTVDDPTTFTRPWTVAIPMTKTREQIYEYACHEGNHAMVGILAGARAQEKAAEEDAKKGQTR